MNTISIWAAISVVLSVCHLNGAAPGSAPLVKLASYHIVKKPIHTVSDKFLSFTADPDTISHVAECSLTNATLNMAKSLTPAYFRLAGGDSNHFVFQSNPNVNHSELTTKSKVFSVSNEKWLKLNNFLSKTGMNVIACVSGISQPTNKDWDLSNTLELITFSDKHNISLDWQLGYELQKLASSQGKQMGRDVTRLRKILDVFPRYRKSLIIGPDMTSFKSKNDAIFVRNYVTEAGDSLNVFTWHPFSKKSEDNEVLEMLSNGMNSMDNYLWIKDGIMKSSSKGVVPKKTIWIAESESTETVSNLTDSMSWIMRMGAAARLGASVYLRKPHLLSFYEPTPEFWTAVLYKSVVGKTVLDIKQTSGNGTNKVHMFTHCTKFIEKPEESIINPEISYDPGAITVYGVNMASESTRISFKIGLRGDETAHLYVLTQDNSNANFPKTLLNKQPLGLSSENELPLISPRVRESPKYLLIPARSIFFVVFPNTKCRSCNEHEQPDASKSKTKILEEEDLDTNTFTSNVLEVMEDENDHDNVYVRYPKRTENGLQLSADPSSKTSVGSNKMDQGDSQMNVKFVTFSEDTWLNTFPEKFKDVVNREKDGSIEMKDKNKAGMYRVLAQAMLGKRTSQNIPKELPKTENPADRFVFEDESESNQFKRALKYPSRFRRSKESATIDKVDSMTDVDNQSIVLYLYDQQENGTDSYKNLTHLSSSKLNTILLAQDTFDQVIDEQNIEDMVLVTTFVKKSTLEDLLKTATPRTKREISNEISVVDKESANSTSLTDSSMNNFTSINSTKGESVMNDPIDEIMDHVAKLVQLFLSMDLHSGKPQQQNNGSNGTTGDKTQGKIYRLLALTMLGKKTTPNASKGLEKSEDPATRFVLDEDLETDEFKKALKNFDRFKRSSQSTPDNKLETKYEPEEIFADSDGMIEPEQNIMKREENTKRSSRSHSQDIALYLFDQQDSESHDFETHKRSTLSKIYAVPLNKDGLQEAMKSSEFRETIPIVTFVRKQTLEGIVGAANDRTKREASSENSTDSKVADNSIPSTTTPSPDNASNKTNDEATTQCSTTQVPLTKEKTTNDPSNDMIEQVDKLMKETKNQSTDRPKLNLQQINSSLPELIMASSGPDVSRGLREVDDDSETGDNVVGHRHLKAIDKANMRPVSPFPKKPKNSKSKSAKGVKGKSSDNVQLPHQTASTPSTSPPSTEAIVSSKRETPEVVSSSQAKQADPAENPASSDDDSEDDDLPEDSTTASKFQSAIAKNLQEHSLTTQSKQVPTEEVVSSKLEEPVSKEVASKPMTPSNKLNQDSVSGTENSDTVGGPHKKLFPAETSKRNRVKPVRPLSPSVKKPKITPQQLRSSYEQKRRDLLQKHLTRLNELRNMLGIPSLPQSHLYKREANIFTDAYDSTKSFVTKWWENLRNWDSKQLFGSEETKEGEEKETGRNKRRVDQDSTESFEIFKGNRPKRNEEMVVSTHVQKEMTLAQLKELTKARIEERHRQMEKIAEEKKAMKAQTHEPRIRLRRGLQKTMEKFQELKEQTQARANERRQKLNKHIEEMKQKRPHHVPSIGHRSKRDLQAIKDKIRELKERNQVLRDEVRQKLAKNIEEIKQRRSHHPPIFARRNRRDVESIQDKINEARKKKQEQRQEMRKKFENEHPSPRAASKMKTKPSETDEPRNQAADPVRTDERPVPQTIPKLKTKPTKIEEPQYQAVDPVRTDEHAAPQTVPKAKTKPAKIEEPQHHADPVRTDEHPVPQSVPKPKNKPAKIDELHHQTVHATAKTDESRHQASKLDEHHHQAVNPAAQIDESHHQAVNPAAQIDESHHQATNPPTKTDETHHQATDKPSRKIHKSAHIREKSHRVHKRERNENQLEEKLTSPSDLQKDLQFRLFVDPELNTPQSMLENDNLDDLDRLRRSLSNNEIFDEDDEVGSKIKNKDHEDFHTSKFNKMDNFINEKEPSTSTYNPLTDMKNDNSKTAPENSGSSQQGNQTCQVTNYNVFKYFWCVAQRLWYTYFRV